MKALNKRRFLSLFLLIWLVFGLPQAALAQTYRFSLDEEVVNVFWNSDGSLALDYMFTFTNNPSADPIDFVDVGIPVDHYDLGSVRADIGGQSLTNIEKSPYVNPGVAVGLGSRAIPPGQTGTLHVVIGRVEKVLYPDDKDANYASAVFKTTWFGSEYVHGGTQVTVTFHLPPGVQPDQPRWHDAPPGFPSQPITALDADGRVTYTWKSIDANGSTGYQFGASFPASVIPAETITRPDPFAWLYGLMGIALTVLPCLLVIGIFVVVISIAVISAKKRTMEYLPPSISIEGHGIKRGLTSVEAALLMEQPTDKILTMILFSVLKKKAAEVVTREPLDLKLTDPKPEGLYAYEDQFLAAFAPNLQKSAKRKQLQDLMVDLVKSLGSKMKGFSRKETIAYYQDIMKKAWAQVETAETPEVKSAKYDEVMDWAMLDKDYEDHTREVFRSGPVFLPNWWWRYDPTFGGPSGGHMASPVSSAPRPSSSMPSSSGGPISMPTMPGADFAAGMVLGVQNMASSVIGNVTDFTSRITDVTNPVPKTVTRSGGGGGGGGCACACACAGCACACAGGGR